MPPGQLSELQKPNLQLRLDQLSSSWLGAAEGEGGKCSPALDQKKGSGRSIQSPQPVKIKGQSLGTGELLLMTLKRQHPAAALPITKHLKVLHFTMFNSP